jgi:branched-chain amino acid transport system ATP-binding protein
VTGHGVSADSSDTAALPTDMHPPAGEGPQTSDGQLLVMDGVDVHFGGVHAIRDVSLSLSSLEKVAVIGQNGAGKSTLLNAICGLVPSRGSIRLHGRELPKRSPDKIIGAGIGRSFQDPQLIEDATVLENVLLGLHSSRLYRPIDQVLRRGRMRRAESESFTKVAAIAEHMHLAGSLDTRVSELTYGARKMVDIARAMVGAPDLLILDEPSSGLDLNAQLVVTDVLQRICAERAMAVLMVEHHMEVVDRIAQRVIEMRAGQLESARSRDSIPSVGRREGNS